jgi:hypothetical protein
MDTDLANTQLSQLQAQGVDAVQTIINQLDSLLGQIADNWKGQDSLNFHSDWNSTLKTQLTNVHSSLTDFHSTFNRNIQDQVATSAS